MNREPKWTPGPWEVVICDTGGEWSGWPSSVCPTGDDEKSIVRPGGQWPYKWDAAISQREALANAHLIAAAPDLYEALENYVTFHSGHVLPSELQKTQAQARAALAKARGEPEEQEGNEG